MSEGSSALGLVVATRDPIRFTIHRIPSRKGWRRSMRTIQDLFAEERSMVTMSLGDHIEELRRRLTLALLGLVVGVVVTLIPPLNLGRPGRSANPSPRSGPSRLLRQAGGREPRLPMRPAPIRRSPHGYRPKRSLEPSARFFPTYPLPPSTP